MATLFTVQRLLVLSLVVLSLSCASGDDEGAADAVPASTSPARAPSESPWSRMTSHGACGAFIHAYNADFEVLLEGDGVPPAGGRHQGDLPLGQGTA